MFLGRWARLIVAEGVQGFSGWLLTVIPRGGSLIYIVVWFVRLREGALGFMKCRFSVCR